MTNTSKAEAKLRLALYQFNPVLADFQHNTQLILNAIQEAKKNKVDLLILPELAVCGYPPEDLLLNASFLNRCRESMAKITKATQEIIVLCGYVHQARNGDLYNSLAIIYNKKIHSVYHKMCLPNYGVFDEKRYFKPGKRTVGLSLSKNIRIALGICEDIWENSGPYLSHFKGSTFSAMINVAASPYHHKKHVERLSVLRSVAKRFKSTLVYVNLVGGQDELVFDGQSCIVTDKGKVDLQGSPFTENLIYYDMPIKRWAQSTYGKSSADDTQWIALNHKILPKHKISQQNVTTKTIKNQKTMEIMGALKLGLYDYVHKNKFGKVIIGLSGGIDSAVVAALATNALGKDNVILVTMPSKFTSRGTLSDAKQLAENLNVKLYEISIQGIFKEYLSLMKPYFAGLKEGLAEENLQARIRGNILMAFSNKFNYLVLTTGNKSELATGYCTLYGDMAGGFAILKDVPKTMVYKIARLYNQLYPTQNIPKSIIMRPPTAELRYNQKDEDSLPPYPVLDSILQMYIEEDKIPSQISSKGHQSSTVKEIIKKVDRNEYKRRQGPIGIKITPKAFGRDRRIPITQRLY